jgi:4-amino-4-deoxy-L-arabinose transferase-like glycosyltransferase
MHDSRSPLGRALDAADHFAEGIERAGAGLCVVLLILYWTPTWLFAGRKLMWNDELYTYYIAKLPTLRDVWSALQAGGEQTPPLFYVLTRVPLQLFGFSNISIRLPEMLGFSMLLVCLFVFVRQTASPLSALCAALFPLVTGAFPYAYEARPYALVLGFSALALVCWQRAALGRHRVMWLACLSISLALTATSHYYGAFTVVPLALGELVRSVERRRIDAGVWIALAVSVVPLAWHLPLIRVGAAYSTAFWSPAMWVQIPDFYTDLLLPAIVPAASLVTAAVVHRTVFEDNVDASASAVVGRLRLHEVAAALGFILLPVIGVIVGKIATGAFVGRYGLSAVIGCAVLAGFGSSTAFRRQPAMRAAAVLILLGWFGLSAMREWIGPTWNSMPVDPALVTRPTEWLEELSENNLPVVVADPHTFIMLSHYGAAATVSRIVYVADPDLALKHLGHNSVERGMLDLLKPWFHLNVVPFEPFIADHSRFLVYGNFYSKSFLNWILLELEARRVHIELLNRSGDELLLLVDDSTLRIPASAR